MSKPLLFKLVLLLGSTIFLYKQELKAVTSTDGYQIEYYYDDSGNRKSRVIIPLASSKSAQLNEDINNEELEKDSITTHIDDLDLSLFPNPTKGILNIGIKNLEVSQEINYMIIDSKGSEVSNGSLELLDHSYISFENFPSGIYILILKYKNSSLSWKIIKQ